MKIKFARAVRSFTITSQDWNALTTEKFVSYEFSYLGILRLTMNRLNTAAYKEILLKPPTTNYKWT